LAGAGTSDDRAGHLEQVGQLARPGAQLPQLVGGRGQRLGTANHSGTVGHGPLQELPLFDRIARSSAGVTSDPGPVDKGFDTDFPGLDGARSKERAEGAGRGG
jgi:hypothetical protein